MKNIYKTLFFVPFLALTSCGAPKISEEKAREIGSQIQARYEEEDYEAPSTLKIEVKQSEKMMAFKGNSYAVEGVDVNLIAEKNLDKNYFHMYQKISETEEGDLRIADDTEIEIFVYVKDKQFISAQSRKGTKQYTITDLSSLTDSEYENFVTYFRESASYYDEMFTYASFLGIDTYLSSDVIEMFVNPTTNYYSKGAGNLEIKLSGNEVNPAYIDDVESLTAKGSVSLSIKVNNYIAESVYMKASVKASGEIDDEGEKVNVREEMNFSIETKASLKFSLTYPNLDDFEKIDIA